MESNFPNEHVEKGGKNPKVPALKLVHSAPEVDRAIADVRQQIETVEKKWVSAWDQLVESTYQHDLMPLIDGFDYVGVDLSCVKKRFFSSSSRIRVLEELDSLVGAIHYAYGRRASKKRGVHLLCSFPKLKKLAPYRHEAERFVDMLWEEPDLIYSWLYVKEELDIAFLNNSEKNTALSYSKQLR